MTSGDDDNERLSRSNSLDHGITWRNRHYLPHSEGHNRAQMVTFAIQDALTPNLIRDRVGAVIAARAEKGVFIDDAAARRAAIDELLDEGVGARTLESPDVAALVEADILHFHLIRYRLHAWVVMPNHVHVLFTPREGSSMSKIIGSWKYHSAQKINGRLKRRGKLWQREYYDRFIRDPEHFRIALAYIERNPVKAKLCESSADWPFSSARRRASNGTLVLPEDGRS